MALRQAAAAIETDLERIVRAARETARYRALVAEGIEPAEKLSQLGITPNLGPNAPAMQAWQGRIGDEAAQVSLLRMDDRQLPDNLRAQLGGTPFQIAAAIVNVVSRKP